MHVFQRTCCCICIILYFKPHKTLYYLVSILSICLHICLLILFIILFYVSEFLSGIFPSAKECHGISFNEVCRG